MNPHTLWDRIKQQHPYFEIQVRNTPQQKVYHILSTNNNPLLEKTPEEIFSLFHYGYSLRFSHLASQDLIIAQNLPYKQHTDTLYITHTTDEQFAKNTPFTLADLIEAQHRYYDVILLNQLKEKPELQLN